MSKHRAPAAILTALIAALLLLSSCGGGGNGDDDASDDGSDDGGSVTTVDRFEFSYVFDSGEILSGAADGTVNGNLVEDLSNIVITFNGTDATNSPFHGGSWDDGSTAFQAGGAVLSFDGTENNFMFSNVPDPTVTTDLTEFWYDITPSIDGVQGIVAIDPESALNLGFRGDGSIGVYGSWTLTKVTSDAP